MNTKQRTAMIFVQLLSLAISSCASGQLFGPTATVTPTLTPTPVATSTPTESHEEIITDAIKTACQMKPAGSPSVGVSAGGSAVARLCPDVDSSLTLPDKWTAKTPGDLLYAVAVQSRSAEFSVKCGPYTKDGLPGGEIYVTLETKNAHISLINAQTGQMVDSAAVSGPHTCPQTIYNTTTSVIGPPPVDDDVLNTIDNLMSKWTTTWSTPPGPVAFSVDSVAFSPDGKLLASGSDKMVNVWNLASGHIVETLPVGYWVGFAFSPDGRLLASG